MRALIVLAIAIAVILITIGYYALAFPPGKHAPSGYSEEIRITVLGGASERLLRLNSSFYFRLYLDGEWCDLWSKEAAFVDNGSHITLVLRNGRGKCHVGIHQGKRVGEWVYFDIYNITRPGTLRDVEPFYIRNGVNAVVIYRDYEMPGLVIRNSTALFVIVEDGVMKYNTVYVKREIPAGWEAATRILNETAKLEGWLISQGVIPAPYKWRYENGTLYIEPDIELRFSKPVEKRPLKIGNVTYYYYFDGNTILLPAGDIYGAATYVPTPMGSHRLKSLVIAHYSLAYLPHPLPKIFGVHFISTGNGVIRIIVK